MDTPTAKLITCPHCQNVLTDSQLRTLRAQYHASLRETRAGGRPVKRDAPAAPAAPAAPVLLEDLPERISLPFEDAATRISPAASQRPAAKPTKPRRDHGPITRVAPATTEADTRRYETD